jgi:putative heme-binding domain-containing protein
MNPYEGDPGAIRAGTALFGNQCSACHGPDAKGGLNAPDLTALWASGATDERVFRTIRNGVPQSAMPAHDAPDNQLWFMVAYLKSLGGASTWQQGSGDPARGRAVFDRDCASCHRIHGRGGRLGPDLSNLAATRSQEAVVRAIRAPNEAVATNFRTVTLTTSAGERIRGIKKGEDAFSIRILDSNERLQGLRKADLRTVEHEQASLMQAFGPVELSEAALDDLLEYLRQETAAALPRRAPSQADATR